MYWTHLSLYRKKHTKNSVGDIEGGKGQFRTISKSEKEMG